ncbi:MAG: hypothetical protein ACREBU_10365 [Nitrososphaera sp.]
MNDVEFVQQFEARTLPAECFHHRDHVKLVWLYLQRYPMLETLVRFSEGLRRFAAANGKHNLYHETITWAYVFLIHERLKRAGGKQSWEEFVAANPDLFNWQNNILKTYYREETLRSELARRVFVFPNQSAQIQVVGAK